VLECHLLTFASQLSTYCRNFTSMMVFFWVNVRVGGAKFFVPLEHTQPPVEWVPGLLDGGKTAETWR